MAFLPFDHAAERTRDAVVRLPWPPEGESLRLGHSSYDLFYLVLARRTGATLFTLDKKMQELALDAGINSIWLTKLGGVATPF